MKKLFGSTSVALLFLGCFSFLLLSQSRDRPRRGDRRAHRRWSEAGPALAMPPAFDGPPGAQMWDPEHFPAMLPREPIQNRSLGWRSLLDADENGEISLEEIDLMAMNLKALDVDGDGKLTFDELPPNPSWRGGSPPFDAEAAFASQAVEVEQE